MPSRMRKIMLYLMVKQLLITRFEKDFIKYPRSGRKCLLSAVQRNNWKRIASNVASFLRFDHWNGEKKFL